MNKGLIIVDYQYDFACPNGSLYVKGAEELSSKITELSKELKQKGWHIIASKDWHPKDHYSFSQWPIHCVENTKGSEFYFDSSYVDLIIKKGNKKDIESYSGFFDEKGNSNGLDEYLKKHNITELEIVGVVTEICVKATYDDAIKLGYNAHINLDYCKGFE
ncbi:isochorismatase family protein [Mycoplasma yeatsii]|uniref:nicotinamidase n=1 Tax=Mycoplasma yeatsii TaxID=51365 RepID=A0ABU0NE26_9MOLU|nr:isochorismatase family protein [Mycoplasma yeatsii]MDQ0567668.1 nicotinamidase/pyrazinamidase [Mycoplasma yeatsii]